MVDRNVAIRKLGLLIETGKAKATKGMEALQKEYMDRKDYMVKPDKLTVEVLEDGSVRPVIENRSYVTTPFSRQQLYVRAKMPQTYAETLTGHGLGQLLKANLEMMFPRVSKEGIMLRTVGELAKGVLSASYKRIDATPVFESFVERCIEEGFVPHEGLVTDTRAFLSFVFPEIIDIGPDEVIVLGAQLRTSDYGRGALEMDLLIHRLMCSNGMMGHDVFKQIHLGRRFDSDNYGDGDVVELSTRTMQLDLATVRSALKDTIGSLRRRQFPALTTALQDKAKGDEKFSLPTALAVLGKKGLKKEVLEKVKTYYESNLLPIESIPQEPGAWRFANVLSLLANGTKNQDDAKDLQDLAFDVLLPEAKKAA